MSGLLGAVSSDIDTLQSLYKGHGLRQPAYTHAEMRIGLENFSRFLERYGANATLFRTKHKAQSARMILADITALPKHGRF